MDPNPENCLYPIANTMSPSAWAVPRPLRRRSFGIRCWRQSRRGTPRRCSCARKASPFEDPSESRSGLLMNEYGLRFSMWPLGDSIRTSEALRDRCLLRRIFVWAPEVFESRLVPGIPCPSYGELAKFKKWSPPRVVFDFGEPFGFFGAPAQYGCAQCAGLGRRQGKSSFFFLNYDPRVLVKLPRSIQNEFPALLTWKLGVSLAVRDFILHNAFVGVHSRRSREC